MKNQVKSALCFEFLWNNFISEKCAITREFGQRIFFLPVRSVKLRDQGRDAEISGKIVQPKAFPLFNYNAATGAKLPSVFLPFGVSVDFQSKFSCYCSFF